MKWSDVDCATNCPFREESLCDYGTGNYSSSFVPDPICAQYGFEEDDDVDELFERVGAEIHVHKERRYAEWERDRTADEVHRAKLKLAQKRRSESKMATFHETRRIAQIDKYLLSCKRLFEFNDGLRGFFSQPGGDRPHTPTIEERLVALPKYAELVAERTELALKKEKILKELRDKRKT